MISSAADLMYVRGVNAVTLDDVRAVTGTSKSQLYKHFPDGKPELVRAVVALRAEQILTREEQRLERLRSMSGLRRWRDALVQGAALQGGAYGCALGNMVVELSDQDDQARTSLSAHFAAWEGLLAAGFRRMQDDGILPAKADPDVLATGLMAALQGGYLLARADHEVAPMATALNMALAHIESLTSRPTKTAKPRKTAAFLTPCECHRAGLQDCRQTLKPPRRHSFGALFSPSLSGGTATVAVGVTTEPDSLIPDYFIKRAGKTIIDAANEGLRREVLRGKASDQARLDRDVPNRSVRSNYYADWNRVVSQPASNQSCR